MKKVLPTIMAIFTAMASSLPADPVVGIPDGILALTGEVAMAPIEIDDASGVQAFDCTITYDTMLLDLFNADITTGSLTSGWTLITNVNDSAGWAKVGLFTTYPLEGGCGSLMEFNFHAIGASGTSDVAFADAALNEDQIPATFDSGSIIIASAPPFPGDANVDGRVDETDAAILGANWFRGPGATWGMGNFNADGYVNDVDATMMAANWHVGVTPTGAIPEPGMIVLLAPVLLLTYRRFSG